jgi:hypothetical protein
MGVGCRLLLLVVVMVCWLGKCRRLCCHQRPLLCQIRPVERQLQQPLLPLLRVLLLLLVRLIT